jgi:hypothetical protein
MWTEHTHMSNCIHSLSQSSPSASRPRVPAPHFPQLLHQRRIGEGSPTSCRSLGAIFSYFLVCVSWGPCPASTLLLYTAKVSVIEFSLIIVGALTLWANHHDTDISSNRVEVVSPHSTPSTGFVAVETTFFESGFNKSMFSSSKSSILSSISGLIVPPMPLPSRLHLHPALTLLVTTGSGLVEQHPSTKHKVGPLYLIANRLCPTNSTKPTTTHWLCY